MRRPVFLALACLMPFTAGLPPANGVTLDLTIEGSHGTMNGAIFQQYSDTGMGSGNIDAFVRIQKTGIQHGYNTDYRPVEYDEDSSASFTHSLMLKDVPTITDDGITYREFLLDINQNGGVLLSLDDLKIALQPFGNLIGHSTIFSWPIYDLDAGQDNSIILDYSINGGSGQGDMLAYIPDTFFMDGFGSYIDDYVYLYSRFGESLPADDGFEEWARGVGGPVIPEPTMLLLLGLGSLLALGAKRKS